MQDLSVIILVGNEELHIRRCLERLAPLKPKQVFVIESQTGDNTHDLAIETARSLGWAALNLTPPDQLLTNQLPPSIDRRAAAEMKVAEWLEGVEEATFEDALVKLVHDGVVNGFIRLRNNSERDSIISGARRFFTEFSHCILTLSDGRCVYFTPDPRSHERGVSNAVAWAEYAVHAVTNGGELVPGENFHSRWFNHRKVENLDIIASTVAAECCVPVLKSNPIADSIKFFGETHDGGNFDVVVRLDEYGNAEANMTEVTFEAGKAKKKRTPRLMPLAKAIETVVCHQAAGTNPSTVADIISFPQSADKSENLEIEIEIEGREIVGRQSSPNRPQSIEESNNREIEKSIPIRPQSIEESNNRKIEKSIPLRPQSIEESENRKIEKSPTTTLTTVFHAYPGNQAAQFNWALDNVKIESKWVLRLDADEYLTDELMARIRGFVKESPEMVDLVALRLGRTWQGRRVRFGCPAKYIPRLFRLGVCRYGDQVMDERFEADPARTIRFEEEFVDDNLNSFEWWRQKHLGYMKREAQKAVSGAHGNKGLYYKMPPYFRAVAYWAARYFLFLGFLDGRTGWSWNFWQALWYRWQVDREIGRLRCRGKV